jgi:uncharacterized protein
MILIGKKNTLTVVKKVDFGLYLDGEERGEILLPKRYEPQECACGDEIEIFLYRDSEDRLIATTETPKAQVGDFAFLEVRAVTPLGAFLDWGLQKDLFVPFNEQQKRMQEGSSYLVYLFLDQTERIAASSKLGKFLNARPHTFYGGQDVDVLIWERTELGYSAIIEGTHTGLIFESEALRLLHPGERVPGRVKQIRPDGKIDLALRTSRHETVSGIAGDIMNVLVKEGGFVPLNDKSAPEVITATFGVSKKTFKQAIGTLYKKKLITIDATGIRIVSPGS